MPDFGLTTKYCGEVTANVIGASKGPKITGFTYKNKTNSSKRWGHRQHYATIEITGIKKG